MAWGGHLTSQTLLKLPAQGFMRIPTVFGATTTRARRALGCLLFVLAGLTACRSTPASTDTTNTPVEPVVETSVEVPVEAIDAGEVEPEVKPPDPPIWPEGFTPMPVQVPEGRLCSIPENFVALGGNPAEPPCELESDVLSDRPVDLPTQTLRVVSWNIEFGKKTDDILQHLQNDARLRQADLILLQETPRLDGSSSPPKLHVTRKLAEALKMNYVFAPGWDLRLTSADGGEHGVAILSKFPMGQATQLRHRSTFDWYKEKQRYGGFSSLGVSLVVNQQIVRVYSVHFATRDFVGTLRAEHGAQIRQDAKAYVSAGAFLVGGDFNTFLCNPTVSTCNRGPQAEPVVRDFLSDAWVDLLAELNTWTQLGFGLAPQRLDWLFAKNLLKQEAAIVQDVRASDHVPLYAVLKITP